MAMRWWTTSCLIASLPLLTGGALRAQQTEVPFKAEQMSDREGSLDKTGELRGTESVDEHATSIPAPAALPPARAEKPLEVPPPPPVPVAQGVPAEILALDTNMPARVTDLLACRMQIATDRRVRLQEVTAGDVLLRWTVQPGGGVTNAEVVAKRDTDPEVLSCVRRKMEAWVFIRAPAGAPLVIQQPLKFD
jgi:hypothetical protein